MKNPALAVLGPAILGALLFAPLTSCGSSSTAAKEAERECLCGSESHDILGCPAACSTGKVDCKNPLCTCEHPAEAPAATPASTGAERSSK